MEYLSAYALASLSGNQPSLEQVKNIIAATGKKVNEGQLKSLFDSVKGKKIEDLIRNGSKKVGQVKPAPQKETKGKQDKKKQEKKEQKPAEKPKPKPQPVVEPVQQPEQELGAGDLFGGDF